jgi:hypothetical protein
MDLREIETAMTSCRQCQRALQQGRLVTRANGELPEIHMRTARRRGTATRYHYKIIIDLAALACHKLRPSPIMHSSRCQYFPRHATDEDRDFPIRSIEEAQARSTIQHQKQASVGSPHNINGSTRQEQTSVRRREAKCVREFGPF